MKIGIMSMHRIINYGSFLQAYGLKKTIESLGNDVEFVDYEVEPCIVKQRNQFLARTYRTLRSVWNKRNKSIREYNKSVKNGKSLKEILGEMNLKYLKFNDSPKYRTEVEDRKSTRLNSSH